MKIYTFPQSPFYGKVFGLAKTLSGTYVCPGWHLVPDGTTRDQIRFYEADNTAKKEVVPEVSKITSVPKEWSVNGSKPGVIYSVTESNNSWNCSCPAKSFQRGDCKHIKAKKEEMLITLSK